MSKDEDEMRKEANRLLSEGMPSEMEQGAIQLHTIYTDLKECGFTRFEALWIIGYMITQPGKVENNGE